ncbi:MAG: VOC family protein, partial [Gemmatimonadales bacterium]
MATRKKRTPTRRARPAARKPERPQRQQPETTRFRSIAPSYTVNDLQRSLAFYRDVLGFHPGDRWEDGGRLVGLELKAGGVSFNINQDDFAKGRDRVKGVGHRLYCLTLQVVDTLAMRIRG